MKTNVERIQYYTRKANEYGKASLDRLKGRSHRRISAYRFPRLMQYKSTLVDRLRLEQDDLNRVRLVFNPAPADYDPFEK